ncbi:ATP-dependent zinc metalloprotease FtsH, partial [Actinomadura kijaniata]
MPSKPAKHADNRQPVPPRDRPDQPWRAEGVSGRSGGRDGGGTRPGGFRPNRNTYFWLLLLLVFGMSYA